MVWITGKFGDTLQSASEDESSPGLVLDVIDHQRIALTIDDAPEITVHCPLNICGRVASVHTALPKFPHYRVFDIRTASWLKEKRDSIEFFVRVLIRPTKRFEKTPTPLLNSIISVYGGLLGRDTDYDFLIVELKDFTFLGKAASETNTKLESSVAASSSANTTPRKKGWARPSFPTPLPKKPPPAFRLQSSNAAPGPSILTSADDSADQTAAPLVSTDDDLEELIMDDESSRKRAADDDMPAAKRGRRSKK